jgi:hypothetical protein
MTVEKVYSGENGRHTGPDGQSVSENDLDTHILIHDHVNMCVHSVAEVSMLSLVNSQ